MDNNNIFLKIKSNLENAGYNIISNDFERPWGGFFVIDETQASKFANQFFPKLNNAEIIDGREVSPKILVVAPRKRLSWQYHHLRSEVWQILDNDVGIIRSQTNEQKQIQILKKGDYVILEKGERHRLVGLNDWATVAEIWQHVDPANLSDESDIVRVEDDFGR